MPIDRKVANVCLVGPLITDDWNLIRNLRHSYLVTIVEHFDFLNHHHHLQETHLLVVDCSLDSERTLAGLTSLKRQYTQLCIVLVDGDLSQQQIAQAFEGGVKDYFASPYHLDLLIERIDSLCTSIEAEERNTRRF